MKKCETKKFKTYHWNEEDGKYDCVENVTECTESQLETLIDRCNVDSINIWNKKFKSLVQDLIDYENLLIIITNFEDDIPGERHIICTDGDINDLPDAVADDLI